MNLRIPLSLLITSALLGLARGAAAQEVPPQKAPVPTTPSDQDPDITGPQPVEARIAELQREKDRLIQEIGYVRELKAKGGLASRVAAKLEDREIDPKAVDVGTAPQPAKPGIEPRSATVMSEEQKEQYLPDVAFVVQGRPVREQAVEELVEYLRSTNPDADENALRSRATMALIQTEFAHASFAETAAEAANQIRDIEASLGRGVEFGHLARNRSQHPSAERDGDLGFLVPNSGHPLKLEQLAFTTEVGHVTPVFRTPLGYNLLRVTEEKEADAGRSVRASLILIPFHEALEEVQQLQRSVSLGQVDIVLRDEAMRELLPPLFR